VPADAGAAADRDVTLRVLQTADVRADIREMQATLAGIERANANAVRTIRERRRAPQSKTAPKEHAEVVTGAADLESEVVRLRGALLAEAANGEEPARQIRDLQAFPPARKIEKDWTEATEDARQEARAA
jgi:hypothetical protein